MKKRIFISMVMVTSVILIGLMMTGCAGRKSAYVLPELQKTGDTSQVESLMKEGDSHYELREKTESLDAAIKSYEKVLEADPYNKVALEKLSVACFWLGDAHLTDKDAQLEQFNKGAQYGERAMALNPEFKALMEQGKRDYECLDVLSKKEIKAAYWAFINLGKWCGTKGFVSIVKNKKKLKSFIDWVVKTDERFYYAGGHRGVAVFYAKAPSFAGGDMDKSKYHFDRCLEIAPNYLTTKVLVAEFYAYKIQDKNMFVKQLKDVINSDPASIPSLLPEQKIAQKKARRLLEKADDMFD